MPRLGLFVPDEVDYAIREESLKTRTRISKIVTTILAKHYKLKLNHGRPVTKSK